MTIAEATNQVREWMKLFGQDTPEKPKLPELKIRELRYRLTDEENVELRMAKTREEALDGIADKLFVNIGDAVAYGFTGEQLQQAFAEVCRSNMSKLWSGYEVRQNREELNTYAEVSETENGDKFIVKNQSGKVIKSPSYSPANLGPIVGGGQ